MPKNLHFPFAISDLSTPRTVGPAALVRQQLEQLLFTIPGERVNRPRFGCGVQRLVFGAASPEVAASAEYVIRLNVNEFMGKRVQLGGVRVSASESTLLVDLVYTIIETGEERAETFARPLELSP